MHPLHTFPRSSPVTIEVRIGLLSPLQASPILEDLNLGVVVGGRGGVGTDVIMPSVP